MGRRVRINAPPFSSASTSSGRLASSKILVSPSPISWVMLSAGTRIQSTSTCRNTDDNHFLVLTLPFGWALVLSVTIR